ncbi:cell division protein ZipA [Marinicellulosiphila megalodicopiae]|uniref:cell division protein ZipA n=1 Tax=Marinicellulosiphila megalodicopiae TaxID=2724896 RepID=UPI003BB043CD
METQTIFFIIGVIVLLVLVIDGIRRMRNASPRYQQKMYAKQKVEVDDISSAELPNGGSRIVKKEGQDTESMAHIKGIDDLEQDLDEHVPVLMDSVEHIIEQLDEQEPNMDIAQQTSLDLQQPEIDEDDVLLQPNNYNHSANEVSSEFEQDSFSAVETEYEIDAVTESKSENSTQKKETAQDVLVLNITSNAETFNGQDLYHAMIAGGLRFGKMNIFHSSTQAGKTQFSLINSVQPGTFDLESINQFNTPGVSLFMQLPCEVDPVSAFEQMKNVSVFIANELNGQVRDDAQNRLTEQTIESYRDRIRQFQRSQLLEQA